MQAVGMAGCVQEQTAVALRGFACKPNALAGNGVGYIDQLSFAGNQRCQDRFQKTVVGAAKHDSVGAGREQRNDPRANFGNQHGVVKMQGFDARCPARAGLDLHGDSRCMFGDQSREPFAIGGGFSGEYGDVP